MLDDDNGGKKQNDLSDCLIGPVRTRGPGGPFAHLLFIRTVVLPATASLGQPANLFQAAKVMKPNSLSPDLLDRIDADWRAANYRSIRLICLFDDPVSERPVALADKKRLDRFNLLMDTVDRVRSGSPGHVIMTCASAFDGEHG